MQYRLLRNNKESGPYTKAQLEEMGLKPYDLLWIEGRGGAWQYASEISDLKSIAPIVEEQPYDRFYKGKEKQPAVNKKTDTVKHSVASIAAAPPAKLPKPRFRISGDKIVMIDNTALEQPQPIEAVVSSIQKAAPVTPAPVTDISNSAKATASPDWEEMYSEWKGEEKDPEPAVATKTQSFDEIKQRYEESKQKQIGEKQNKTASATKQNIMAAVAIIVLAIGGYAGYQLNQNNDGTSAKKTSPPLEQAEIINDETNKQQNTGNVPAATLPDATTSQLPIDNGTKTPASAEIKNTINAADEHNTIKQAPPVEKNNKNAVAPVNTKLSDPTVKNPAANNTATTLEVNKKNTQPTITPAIKKADVTVPVKDKKTDGSLSDVNKANTAAPLQIPAPSETTTVKQSAPKKRISDYVSINKLSTASGSNGVQNVQLSVKNITDFPIDLAVVDIQYYAANGHYLKGETMYVKNIGSGDNVNVRVPDNKIARSINYKVSLVSSEQRTLYLVGD